MTNMSTDSSCGAKASRCDEHERGDERVSDQIGGKPLFEEMTPELITRNAFRVTQLDVDASQRELAKLSERAQMAEKLGRAAIEGPCVLPLPVTPDAAAIRSAIQRLRDPELRLVDELFWFWPRVWGQSDTDEALRAFRAEGDQQAVSLWTDEQSGPGVLVARHNLAVYSLVVALDGEAAGGELREQVQEHWVLSCERWSQLFATDAFWIALGQRIEELDDPRLDGSTLERLRRDLPATILLFNARFAAEYAEAGDTEARDRHRSLLFDSGFPDGARDVASQTLVCSLRDRVSALCASARNDVQDDKHAGLSICYRLLEQAKPLVAAADALTADGDPQRAAFHDEVALAALSCLISYGNETDDWAGAIPRLGVVERWALGSAAKERIGQNLTIAKGNASLATEPRCRPLPRQNPVGTAGPNRAPKLVRPALPKRRKRRWPWVVAAGVVVLIVLGIATSTPSTNPSSSSADATASTPAPMLTAPVQTAPTPAYSYASTRLWSLDRKLAQFSNQWVNHSQGKVATADYWARQFQQWKRSSKAPPAIAKFATAEIQLASTLRFAMQDPYSNSAILAFNRAVDRVNAARHKAEGWELAHPDDYTDE